MLHLPTGKLQFPLRHVLETLPARPAAQMPLHTLVFVDMLPQLDGQVVLATAGGSPWHCSGAARAGVVGQTRSE